eukprot:s2015_g10.t1
MIMEVCMSLCNKCRKCPPEGNDSWCLGCTGVEALNTELCGAWYSPSLRAIANDLVVSAVRGVRALRNTSSSLQSADQSRAAREREDQHRSSSHRGGGEHPRAPSRSQAPPKRPATKDEEESEESESEESGRSPLQIGAAAKIDPSRRPPEPPQPPRRDSGRGEERPKTEKKKRHREGDHTGGEREHKKSRRFWVRQVLINEHGEFSAVVKSLGCSDPEWAKHLSGVFNRRVGTIHFCESKPCFTTEEFAMHVTRLRVFTREGFVRPYINHYVKKQMDKWEQEEPDDPGDSVDLSALGGDGDDLDGDPLEPEAEEVKTVREPGTEKKIKEDRGRPSDPRVRPPAGEGSKGITEDERARLRARLAEARTKMLKRGPEGGDSVLPPFPPEPPEEEHTPSLGYSPSVGREDGPPEEDPLGEAADRRGEKKKKKTASGDKDGRERLPRKRRVEDLGPPALEDTNAGTTGSLQSQLVKRARETARLKAEKSKEEKRKQAQKNPGMQLVKMLTSAMKGMSGKEEDGKKEKKAEKKKKAKKRRSKEGAGDDPSSPSSSSSSSPTPNFGKGWDGASDSGDSSSEEKKMEAPLKRKSKAKPGSVLQMLLEHARGQLDQSSKVALTPSEGMSLTRGVKMGSYFAIVVRPQLGGAMGQTRELHHIAQAIDLLRQGDLDLLGDVLAGRFMSIHQAVLDGSWSSAKYLELMPLEDGSAAGPAVVLQAKKHARLQAKIAPGENWSWQGGGKSRGGRGRGSGWGDYQSEGKGKSKKGGKGKGKGKPWQNAEADGKTKEKPAEKCGFPHTCRGAGGLITAFAQVALTLEVVDALAKTWASKAWAYLSVCALNRLAGNSACPRAQPWTLLERRAVESMEKAAWRRCQHDTDGTPTSLEEWQKDLGSRSVGYSGEEISICHELTFEQVLPALPPMGHGGSIDALDWVGNRTKDYLLNPEKLLKPVESVELPRMPGRVHVKKGDLMAIADELVKRKVCRWIPLRDVYQVNGVKVLNGLFGVAKPTLLSRALPPWMNQILAAAERDDKSWWHIYSDNFAGGERISPGETGAAALLCHNAAELAWSQAGIVSADKKRVTGAKRATELGAEIDGELKTLGVSTEKLLKIIQATLWLVSRPFLEKKHVQILAGRWVFALQFRRPAMGFLQKTWEFVGGKLKVTPSVREQIKAEFMSLVFSSSLLHCNLGASVSEAIICTDASEYGGSVDIARELTPEGRDFLGACERMEAGDQTGCKPFLIISLFNGIGGSFRAYDLLGISPVGRIACEIADEGNRITQRRWPGTLIVKDVRQIDKEMVLQWSSKYLQVEEVHLWGGWPCVDLSAVRYGRLNLAGEHSSLFWEIPRILRLLMEVFGPTTVIKYVLENVASMDREASDQITRELGVWPYRLDCVQAVPMRRPRYCWTSEDIAEAVEGVSVVEKRYWNEVEAAAPYPATSQWLTPNHVWEGEQEKAGFEDVRHCLLGDSFSIYSFVILAAACAKRFIPKFHYKHLASRMGVAPGFQPHFRSVIPLCRSLSYGSSGISSEWFNKGVQMVNRLLLRKTNHTGSDIRMLTGEVMNVKAFPRQSVESAWWHWSNGFRFKWKNKSHINVLELETVLQGIKFQIGRCRAVDQRIFQLSDSYVSMSVVAKGRSSSKQLTRVLNHISCHLLAFGLHLVMGHVESGDNPSDEGSRKPSTAAARWEVLPG